jgi:ElaA protein
VIVDWRFAAFRDLAVDELHAILAARARVFIVEQNCPFLDPDGFDAVAWHLWTGAPVRAYLRILPAGTKHQEPALGRVITAREARRTGLGRVLVAEGIRRAETLFGRTSLRIDAQTYLERFYGEFGFARCSDEYIEDGIPHIEMLRARVTG